MGVKMKRSVVAAVVAALSLAGAFGIVAALNGSEDKTSASPRDGKSRTSASPTRMSLAGYPLPQDPQSAIEFGSTYIFEATVTGPPQEHRKIEPNAETGAPGLVYLPVPVRVTAVYKGDLKPGDQVFLRDLGGTAADGTTLNYENGWPDETWKPGVRLFLFSQESVVLGGQAAITPNIVFVDDNGSARSAVDASAPTMPIERMREKVTARWR